MPPVAQKQAPVGASVPTVVPIAEPKKSKPKREEVEYVDIERPVIYPIVRAEVCTGKNAITMDVAKQILEWETEKEYQARQMIANPGTEAAVWAYGEVYMLKDEEGNKIRCLNNLDNRPFDETWSRGLAQSILRFAWAGEITISEMLETVYGNSNCEPWTHPETGVVYNPGDPITLPAGTINGSTIAVSRSGRVESGQHSLCALILAWQIWNKDRTAYPQWNENTDEAGNLTGPVIETVLITGVSEDRRVIMTVDNCKPRSETDVFYTSELFRKFRDQPGKRKEMSRMLANCSDLFWKRTGVKGYKTHAEVMAMIERHMKLLKCLEHIFTENGDTKRDEAGKLLGGKLLSALRLSAGQCVALCYLMGCSASDGDEYRNATPAPSEKGLDWSRWDQAKEFWALLGSAKSFEPVRVALARLVEGDKDSEDNPGLGGRLVEKLAILAKAWEVFVTEGRHFTELDLTEGGCLYLTYSAPTTVEVKKGDEVVVTYVPAQLQENDPDFGGIDMPDQKAKSDPVFVPTKEQVQAESERLRAEKAKEAEEKIRQMRLGQASRPAVPKPVTGPATAPPKMIVPGSKLKGGIG